MNIRYPNHLRTPLFYGQMNGFRLQGSTSGAAAAKSAVKPRTGSAVKASALFPQADASAFFESDGWKFLQAHQKPLPRSKEYMDALYASSPYDLAKRSDESLLKTAANITPNSDAPKLSDEEMLARLQEAMQNGTLKTVTQEQVVEQFRRGEMAFSSGVDLGQLEAELTKLFQGDMAFRVSAVGSPDTAIELGDEPRYLFADQALDATAAMYAFYMGRADDGNRAQVEQIFTDKLGEYANGFAEKLSHFEDAEGIKSSMQQLMRERASGYGAMLQGGFSTGVEGTEDEWALNSGYFMAAKLVQSGQAQSASGAQSKYSFADIKAIATMDVELKHSLRPSGFDSEESMGFALGLLGAKNELALSMDGVSDNGRKLLRSAFESYVDDTLAAAEKHLEFLRSDPYTDKAYGYSPYNSKAVVSVINKTLAALEADHFADAINTLLDDCRSMVSAKAQSRLETQGKADRRYADAQLSSGMVTSLYESFNGFASFMGFSSNTLSGGAQIDVRV